MAIDQRITVTFQILTFLLCQSVQKSELADEWKGARFGKALHVDAAFDKLHVYTTIPNVSFRGCKEECTNRYECGFINFWKRLNLCYILRTVDPFVEGYENYIQNMSGHLLGVKSQWMESEMLQMNDTIGGKNASTGSMCKPRLHITNTRAVENLTNEDHMVVYSYDDITDVELSVCTAGNFQHLAGCKIYQKYRDECTKLKNANSNQISCYVLFWEPYLNGTVQQSGQRQLNTVLAVENGGIWGIWHEPAFCPRGKFAFAYTLVIDEPKGFLYDDTSLNGVILHCGSFNELDMRSVDNVTSGMSVWSSTHVHVKCPESDKEAFFLTSFKMRVDEYQGTGDDTAANDVRFRCRDFLGNEDAIVATTESHGQLGAFGSWSDSCPPKSAVCGIRTRVEESQGQYNDDTALNDMKAYCCRF